MISRTSDPGYDLYTEKLDMGNGMARQTAIIRTEMRHDPYLTNGVYVFRARDLKKIKVLSRGLRRFELTLIRLDEEKFFRPIFDEKLCCYKISWSDFVLLTEGVQKRSVTMKNIA